MSLDHLTPSVRGGDEGHHPADRDQALAHLGGEIALAADRDQDVGIALGVAGARRALGLENFVADGVHVAAGALQNVGIAVDHRVEQLHQHHFAGDAGRAGARQLVLHQHERLRLVIAHGHQAMAGEDEGHRRGARIFGVRRAHQRRRHVARAVLDIEPAGNLDLLHVLPGRHRDPGQPLHRLVLRRGRFDEIDPDRALRQRGEIGGGDFLQRGFGGDEHRQHGGLRDWAGGPTQQDLARFWQALHDGALAAGRYLRRRDGGRRGPDSAAAARLPKNQPETPEFAAKKTQRPCRSAGRASKVWNYGRFRR